MTARLPTLANAARVATEARDLTLHLPEPRDALDAAALRMACEHANHHASILNSLLYRQTRRSKAVAADALGLAGLSNNDPGTVACVGVFRVGGGA